MKIQVKNIRIKFLEKPHSGFAIMANDRFGYEYVLIDNSGDYRVMSYVKADMLIDKIKAAGNMISPEHWSVRAPYGTAAWMMDGMELRQIEDERFGYC